MYKPFKIHLALPAQLKLCAFFEKNSESRLTFHVPTYDDHKKTQSNGLQVHLNHDYQQWKQFGSFNKLPLVLAQAILQFLSFGEWIRTRCVSRSMFFTTESLWSTVQLEDFQDHWPSVDYFGQLVEKRLEHLQTVSFTHVLSARLRANVLLPNINAYLGLLQQNCPRISFVNLLGCGPYVNANVLDGLGAMSQITDIRLSMISHLKPKVILKWLQSLPRLKTLFVMGMERLQDFWGMIHSYSMSDSTPLTLEHLSLQATTILEMHNMNLACLANVQTLCLSQTQTTDVSLFQLHNLPNLKSLEIRFCNLVTSSGILHVLRCCTKLEHLDIVGCTGVTLGAFGKFLTFSKTGESKVSNSLTNLTVGLTSHYGLRSKEFISLLNKHGVLVHVEQNSDEMTSDVGEHNVSILEKISAIGNFASMDACLTNHLLRSGCLENSADK
jgi:hypothetical protein